MPMKLKPCPFCGGKPTLETAGYTRINCDCGLSMSNGGRSAIKLIEQWNTRYERA